MNGEETTASAEQIEQQWVPDLPVPNAPDNLYKQWEAVAIIKIYPKRSKERSLVVDAILDKRYVDVGRETILDWVRRDEKGLPVVDKDWKSAGPAPLFPKEEIETLAQQLKVEQKERRDEDGGVDVPYSFQDATDALMELAEIRKKDLSKRTTREAYAQRLWDRMREFGVVLNDYKRPAQEKRRIFTDADVESIALKLKRQQDSGRSCKRKDVNSALMAKFDEKGSSPEGGNATLSRQNLSVYGMLVKKRLAELGVRIVKKGM